MKQVLFRCLHKKLVIESNGLMSVFLSLCPLRLLGPQLDCDLSLELNSELDWGGELSSGNMDGGGGDSL